MRCSSAKSRQRSTCSEMASMPRQVRTRHLSAGSPTNPRASYTATTVVKTIDQRAAISLAQAAAKAVETMARSLANGRSPVRWASFASRRSQKTLGRKPTQTHTSTVARRGIGPLTANSQNFRELRIREKPKPSRHRFCATGPAFQLCGGGSTPAFGNTG